MHECVHVFVSVCILCLCVCGGALALSSGVAEAVQEGVGSRGRTSGAAQAGILDGIVGEVRGGTEPRASVSPDLQLPSNPDLASGAEEGTAGGGAGGHRGPLPPKRGMNSAEWLVGTGRTYLKPPRVPLWEACLQLQGEGLPTYCWG